MPQPQVFERQASRSPCPATVLTFISTTTPTFELVCGVDFDGSDLIQYAASSLSDCITRCASNTSCRGVSFEPNSGHGPQNCYLKTLPLVPITRNFPMDSAVALPVDVQDDCESLAEEVSSGSALFHKYCGLDYPQNDMGPLSHAQSMTECLSICASIKACAGVSYEAAMTHGHGYWNCYLKSATGQGGLTRNTFKVDSAFVIGPASGNVTVTAISPSASPTLLSTAPTSIPVQTLTVGPTATQTRSATGKSSSLSAGAIAGAVVGSVLGLGLILFVGFACLKRRKRNSAPAEYPPDTTEYYGYEGHQGDAAGLPGYMGKSVVRQELHADSSPRRELPG